MRASPQRAGINRFAVALVFAFVASQQSFATELKLATWNLEWLTERVQGLPPNVRPKAMEDIERLKQYAIELDADIIAIQEVDGRDMAARVFPPDRYSIHMTRDRVVQRVGLAVRRGLHYIVNPDLTGLDVDPGHELRSGADITVQLTGASLRVLAVHLKTGCMDGPLRRSSRRSCKELLEQIPQLSEWIAARRDEGIPFAVLGDLNRHMEGRDEFWAALRRTAPLIRVTEGHTSPCWGGEAFIDHIILGGPARDWLTPDPLRVLVYRETDRSAKERLSDHCPVSVRLRLGD